MKSQTGIRTTNRRTHHPETTDEKIPFLSAGKKGIGMPENPVGYIPPKYGAYSATIPVCPFRSAIRYRL